MPLLRPASAGRGAPRRAPRGGDRVLPSPGVSGRLARDPVVPVPFVVPRGVREAHFGRPSAWCVDAARRFHLRHSHRPDDAPPKLLDAAFGQLERERLDVLLLGGDYVFLEATAAKAERLTSLVRRVPAARKFAVLGNRNTSGRITRSSRTRSVVRARSSSATRARSSTTRPAPGHCHRQGLDEPWTGALDAVRAVRGVGDMRAVIVLCHSPDGADCLTPSAPSRRCLARPWGSTCAGAPMADTSPRRGGRSSFRAASGKKFPHRVPVTRRRSPCSRLTRRRRHRAAPFGPSPRPRSPCSSSSSGATDSISAGRRHGAGVTGDKTPRDNHVDSGAP